MDKMTQLAALLVDHDMIDELDLGELYREMGQPLKSRARLAKVDEEDQKLCAMQLTLLKRVTVDQLDLVTNFIGPTCQYLF